MKVQSLHLITGLLFLSFFSYWLEPYIGYQSVGLILLLPIFIAAFTAQMKFVLGVGFISALIWDFFFIPPKFHLSISGTQDRMMILTYFTASMIMSVIAKKFQHEQRLIESERLYRALLDSVSHDLRTPLTIILGSACVLNQEEVSKELSSSSKHLISDLISASHRLSDVINNLLDMSRIKSGVLRPKKDIIDIALFLEDFLKRHQEDLNQISFQIESTIEGLYILGDEGLLESVFLKIFENTIKYGGSSNKVIIHFYLDGDLVNIKIKDCGPGIPPNKLNHLFSPFNSDSNSNSNSTQNIGYSYLDLTGGGSGLGLGLFISKSFIEAQGGKMFAENNREGKGLIITIEFPRYKKSHTFIVDNELTK